MSSIENSNYALNEMMVHVPLCTHKEPENILILGEVDDEFKEEISKHKVTATFSTIEALNSHNKKDIDVILFMDIKIDEFVLANVQRVLKDDGLIAFKTDSFHSNKEQLKKDLRIVGEKFWIAMPYSFVHTTLIIASKKYHPTADIVLQRSDLLDDLNYYSTEIHHASFVFPANIHKELTTIAKR